MENKYATLWTKDFITITMINLFLFLGFQMIVTTLPVHVENMGATEGVIGWITGLTTISAFLIRPFTGVVLDKLGRRIVFLIGHIVLIITTYLFGVFNFVWPILIIRFINGLGWGIATTTSVTVASDTIPIQRFGEGIGLFNISNGLGMALGPVIGLSILNAMNFSTVSNLGAGLGIVALLLSQIINYKKEIRQVDTEKKILPYEKRSLGPAVVMSLVTVTYGAVVAFISLYGKEQGIHNIGLYFTIYAIFLMCSRPIYGKMIDSRGLDLFVYLGFAILIVALFVLSRANHIYIFILSAALYGIGFGAMESSLLTMAVTYAPEGSSGAANATFFTGFDGGMGIGSIVAGIIVSNTSYSVMYLSMIIPLLFGIVLYRCMKKNR